MIDEELKKIKNKFEEKIKSVSSLGELLEVKGEFVGRKRGKLTEKLKKLRELPPEERRIAGKLINELKTYIENQLKEAQKKLESGKDFVDLTLPGYSPHIGTRHLLMSVMNEIVEIFMRMGYGVEKGPEVETDYNNFTALNIPEDHPARDEHDTFYLDFKEKMLLRTHTSPVQIRTMLKRRPPIKIIAPGRVYRRDDPDDFHSPVFYQVEGLVVGKGITFGDLKGTLIKFLETLFERDLKVRFRPSFFPFTEPSAEVDVYLDGEWIEILGCGMVDPAVFYNVGIDPEEFQGFAFGLGVDRIAMIKHKVRSLRLFYENDLRYLGQFK